MQCQTRNWHKENVLWEHTGGHGRQDHLPLYEYLSRLADLAKMTE